MGKSSDTSIAEAGTDATKLIGTRGAGQFFGVAPSFARDDSPFASAHRY